MSILKYNSRYIEHNITIYNYYEWLIFKLCWNIVTFLLNMMP